MAVTNFLRQYLVKIGWDFDRNGLKSADDELNKFFDGVDKHLGSMTKGFVKLGTLAASAYSAILKQGWNILDQVAKEDRDMEMLARRYYANTEAMRAHENALEQLGLEYEDLFYATDEVLQDYYELARLGKSLEPPEGLKKTVRLVQEIQLQFKKINIIRKYLWRNIAYYIGEKSNGALVKLRDTAKEFVDWLINHLPYISERLANLFSKTINFASKALQYAPKIIEALLDIFDFVANVIEEVSSLIGYIFKVGGAFDDARDHAISFKDVLDFIVNTLHQAVNVAKALVDTFMLLTGKISLREWASNFASYGDEFRSYLGSFINENENDYQKNQEIEESIKRGMTQSQLRDKYSDSEILAYYDQNRKNRRQELKGQYLETNGEWISDQKNIISRLVEYIKGNTKTAPAMTYGVTYDQSKNQGDVTINNRNTYNVGSTSDVRSLERSQAENISKYINIGYSPTFG